MLYEHRTEKWDRKAGQVEELECGEKSSCKSKTLNMNTQIADFEHMKI